MLKKLIVGIAGFAAITGAGIAFACKDDILLAHNVSQYQATLESENYNLAYTLASRMAADGYMPAHTFLGDLYRHGKGVPQNPDLAITQYRLAATAGDGVAQARLADFYLRGEGVEQDIDLALHWYEKAAAGQEILEDNINLADIRALKLGLR